MADFSLSRRFVLDFAEWAASVSERDREDVERVMSEIAANPRLAGRFPSFYDPANPSFLYRRGSVVIHYRVAEGTVLFLNLYHR